MSNSFLVTVGTTEFEQLIDIIDNENFISNLTQTNIKKITLQIGKGKLPYNFLLKDKSKEFYSKLLVDIDNMQNDTILTVNLYNININILRYSSNLPQLMSEHDLVIGHLGAGTLLELNLMNHPYLAIVNDSLQDNHQIELAIALNDSREIDDKLLEKLPLEVYNNIIENNLKDDDINLTSEQNFLLKLSNKDYIKNNQENKYNKLFLFNDYCYLTNLNSLNYFIIYYFNIFSTYFIYHQFKKLPIQISDQFEELVSELFDF